MNIDEICILEDRGFILVHGNDVKEFLQNKIFVNRMGKVEDISSMCIFLSSNYSNYINGSNIVIDGGFSDRI